jgi:anti-sigma B factor antagonist/stage II sporulation protein AA (anti-sigma F factor antagonist)
LENIEKTYFDGVIVIKINLIRAILNESIALREIVDEEINSGQTQLVIDLSECVYVDSTFFGAIVLTSKRLINIGYRLRVVEPVIVGQSVVMNLNTSKLFDKYKTREEAILSFEEDIQPES